MTNQSVPTISIITATYNAAAVLPRLIESLIAQTDQNFEWVVADGASTDGTLALLEQAKTKFERLVVDSRPDFGIYDALNRAVKLANGDYYLVLGADDELFSNAISDYKSACGSSRADLVSAKYYFGDRLIELRRPRWEFLFSQGIYVYGHAVGLAVRKRLHENVGLYSRRFPITADQFFILAAIRRGGVVHTTQTVVGKFGAEGISTRDVAGLLTESFRVRLAMGHGFWVQLILLTLLLIKHRKRISCPASLTKR